MTQVNEIIEGNGSVAEFDLGVRGGSHLPEIVIFEHGNFGGASERTVFNVRRLGRFWNDKVSSVIVVSGQWRLCEHWDYGGASVVLGPGFYPDVTQMGLPNDALSSFRAEGL